MKMYDYLVAYQFTADGYLTASSGTMQISRKNKINSFEELNSVVKFITEQIPGAKNVSVYNFILLGRNKH
jgi:hypothetical protein